MNTRKLLVSVLMLVSALLSACVPETLPATSTPTSTQASNEFTLAGDPIPDSLLNIDYISGKTALRLRPADDPICQELQTEGNCFTILRTDHDPKEDPGARGPAALVNGLVAAKFQLCPFCDLSEIGTIEYFELKENGSVLVGVKCETSTGATCSADVGTTWERETQKTTVSPNLFKIPISITFGPDWSYSGSALETITLNYRPSKLFIDFIIVDNSTLLESSEPPTRIAFPDDFAGYLQSNDFWSEVTPANPVIIGGVNGYQIDAIGKSLVTNRAGFLSLENSPHHEFIYPNPQRYRFFFFDNISGSRLLIAVGTDNPDLLSISQFDEILPKVQEVIDTVTFGG